MKIDNDQLLALYKKERDAKKSVKLLALYQVRARGMSITSVATALMKSYNTIKAWIKRFAEHGPDGLDDKPRSGRPPKLKNHKLDEFFESSPVFPKILTSDIESKTGVLYTHSGVRKILRKRGYSPKVPSRTHARQAPIDEVIKWQKYMKYWIWRLNMDRYQLYVMDQTTIVLDYVSKRGPWSPVGQRVYETYHGTHQRVMVCGAFSTGAPPVFSITDQFKAQEALDFIRDLTRHRKVGLVMDKAKVHDSKIVKDYIEANPHKIRVAKFPSGWPQLNASEFAWGPLKSQPYVHAKYASIEERIDSVENFLNTYPYNLNVEQHLFKKIAKT